MHYGFTNSISAMGFQKWQFPGTSFGGWPYHQRSILPLYQMTFDGLTALPSFVDVSRESLVPVILGLS